MAIIYILTHLGYLSVLHQYIFIILDLSTPDEFALQH